MSNIDFTPVVRQVNEVARAVNAVQAQVSSVESQVGAVSRDLEVTTDELRALRSEFAEFILVAERTANIQRSETKLGTLKDDLEREFGHYNVVRRSSIGTLQAFDIGNVTDKTVQQVSEELMIQTPRYWLAPALVALAAWSRDNSSLSEKSVEAAFSRDRAKTSLFFALVLRRQGRLESATRWLRHYFTSLDPRNLTREFGVMLEAVAQDAFGASGRELILTQLSEWSGRLRGDPEIVAEQVKHWTTEIAVQRGVLDDSLFPRLAELSPQWATVKDVLEFASALENVTAKYQIIFDSHPPLQLMLEDRMDDLLETLVTDYDADELPLRREIVFHEAVLEAGGDLSRARESADAQVGALEETLDAVSLVTHAALHPDLLGIGEHTQKLAIGANKEDFEAATGQYTAGYRQRYVQDVEIALSATHSNYATALGFTGWKSNTATAETSATKSLSDAWDATVAAYIEKTRFKNSAWIAPSFITAGVGIVFGLFGLGGGGAGFAIGFFIGLVLAGGISAIVIFGRKRKADAAVLEAEQARDKAKEYSLSMYRDFMAEWTDAGLTYRDRDSKEKGLLSLIEAWPALGLVTLAVSK